MQTVLAQSRPFAWTPVLFGLGIAVYFALPVEPVPSAAYWLSALVLALALIAWRTGHDGLRIACLAAALVASGLLAGTLRTQAVRTPVLADAMADADVAGTVLSVARPVEGGLTLVVAVSGIAGLAPDATPRRLRLGVPAGWRGRAVPDVGDRVRLRARLWPTPPPVAPGAYDYGRRLFYASIGGLGQVRAMRVDRDVDGVGAGHMTRLRSEVADRLRAAVPGAAGGVAVALVTGDRSGIPDRVTEDLRIAGLAHLLAISGLHMGLVVGAVFGAVRGAIALVPPLALRWPAKKIAAVAAMLAATAYLGLSGMSVPTVRAFLMAMLVLVAVLIDRRAISLRTVALAAILILAWQPEALLEAGFQMSFAAVIALVAVYEAWATRPRAEPRRAAGMGRRVLLYFGGVAMTSLIAGLATAPFGIHHFDRIATLGLVANLLAVPVVALLVMPALVAGLLLEIAGAGAGVLALAGQGIEGVIAVAARVAAVPGAEVIAARPPAWCLAVLVLGGLVALLQRGGTRWLGLVPLGIGVAGFLAARGPDILIDDIGATIAVRHGERGAYAVHLARRSAFSADRWLKADGDARTVEAARAGWTAACTQPDACTFTVGETVEVLADIRRDAPAGALDACMRHAVVIVPRRMLACPEGTALVIDRAWLSREGATALQVDGTVPRVDTVARHRGERPWVPRPVRRTPQ